MFDKTGILMQSNVTDVSLLFRRFADPSSHFWGKAPRWKGWFVERQIEALTRTRIPRMAGSLILQDEINFLILELNKNGFDEGGFLITQNDLFQRNGEIVYEVTSFRPVQWEELERKTRRYAQEGMVYRVYAEEEQTQGLRDKRDPIECDKRADYLAGDLLTRDEILAAEVSKIGSKYRAVSWDELKSDAMDWLFIRGLSTKGPSTKRAGRALYEIKRVVEKKWGGRLEVHEGTRGSSCATTFSVILPAACKK